MSDVRYCLLPACWVVVPQNREMCREHWAMLPRSAQRRLADSWGEPGFQEILLQCVRIVRMKERFRTATVPRP